MSNIEHVRYVKQGSNDEEIPVHFESSISDVVGLEDRLENIESGEAEVSFNEATTRINIASGDTPKTMWGKIKKFFTDLKTVAFSGSYTDLIDKPTSLPANGGNSDTVDGKHASEFYDNNLGTITDLNNTLVPGDGVYLDATNQFGVLIGSLWTVRNSCPDFNQAVSIVQEVICTYPESGAGTHKMRTYYVTSGGWSDWKDVGIEYPEASATTSGIVSTGVQTFAGRKTFNNGLCILNGSSFTAKDSSGNERSILNFSANNEVLLATPGVAHSIMLGNSLTSFINIRGPVNMGNAYAYGISQARNSCSGNVAATTSNTPSGTWRGVHS